MKLVRGADTKAARRIEVGDARADGRRRVVIVERHRIAIARSVAGVFMRISLAPSAFQGVLLRLVRLDDAGFHYEIHLMHRDPDLGVVLAEADDQAEAEAAWRRWAQQFHLPALSKRARRRCAAAAADFACGAPASSRAARSGVPNSASRLRASANCSLALAPVSERGAGRRSGL
jgi:hypothetical protein